MRKKKSYIYLGAVLILFVAIDVIFIHGMLKKELYLQQKIESLLPQKAESMASDYIRVLIKTSGFHQITHSEVSLQCSTGLVLKAGEMANEYTGTEIVTITPKDERFKQGTITVESKKPSEKICITTIERGYGYPCYRGSLELFCTAEGIVIVNELSMEQYLYAVVPSEMPASYEQEALKVQAVCARSYAYNQSRNYAYPEYRAHVDDSTSFQVYGNSKEQPSTIQAVDDTVGEMLWYNDRVATAYYYSTSCGRTTSIRAWGTEYNENNQYLKSVEICDADGNAYERELPWYQWKAEISKETLCNLLELNTGTEIGDLQSFLVTEQGDGGVVQQITAIGDKGSIVVETENKIRRVLGGEGYIIEKQDGTMINSTALLPSAFFSVVKEEDNYIIRGGGYGHGIGMSQNGANEMAKAGKTYREILTTFYVDVEIK